jgi:2-methylcitrate dehydratase PrpD
MNETRFLAQFVTETTHEDLPADAFTKARQLILDSFGVQLAASTKPWSKIVYRYVTNLGGRQESTIVNYGDRCPVPHCAFANASFAHGFEIDDTHRRSGTHVSCVVVPAALALAESRRTDGREFLLATALGLEVMARVGSAVGHRTLDLGIHPTPAAGPFGAAAAASKLLHFDEQRVLNALAIAGSHSCGLLEFCRSGGSQKRMHAGLAAEGGLRSAFLAGDGLTGPPTILEGEWGFCNIFSWGDPRVEAITAGLGSSWEIMQIAYKRFCQDYELHAMMDALLSIVENHSISPDAIREVIVRCPEVTTRMIGTMREPQEVTAAHFSANFSLAVQLVKGSAGFGEYSEETLKDPRVRELAKRIRLEPDEELSQLYPAKMPAKVVVRLRDGSTHETRVDSAKGTPENPLSDSELEEKFRQLATVVLDGTRVHEIIETVRTLETVQDVSKLARLLVV